MKIEKCEVCRMHFQGFHICLELTEAERGTTELKNYRSYPRQPRTGDRGYGGATEYNHSDEVKSQLREATIARHAANRILNEPRNKAIIEDYKAGKIGVMKLAKKYRTSHTTVYKVLHEARDKGLITMRQRGHTVSTGA